MNKEYAKYIQTPYGFIEKTEVVGDQIHIYTAETKRGEPHKLDATPENFAYVDKILTNQYNLIIENRKIVEEHKANERANKIYCPVIIISVLSLITVAIAALTSSMLWIPALAVGFAAAITGTAIDKYFEKKDKKELDLIASYQRHKSNIEILSQTDKNVTEYLSKGATSRLRTNQERKANGQIENVFTTDFMDKLSKKDLEQLILRYKISLGLQQEAKFIKPKKRTKKKCK